MSAQEMTPAEGEAEKPASKAMTELPESLHGFATINADRSVTLTFEEPVEIAGTSYAKITAQRPKGRHVRTLGDKSTGMGGMMDWVLGLANAPTAVADKLDVADAFRLAEVGGFFCASSPTAGKR